ncbi:MAG: (d)CMP kinase, partial [Rhodobacteraceae bacterium]|nr:(d)CMP kinase [Paracoccaceae bacterium]
TASDRVRAMRRFEELRKATPDLTLETVERDIKQRDIRDASRDAAPMVAAADALVLDTTELTIEAAVAAAIAAVRAVL